MTITAETTSKVANLARLDLTDLEKQEFTQKLNGIMDWIEQLQAVNTDGVEPLAKVHDIETPMRADVVSDGDVRDKVLENAPESLEGYFVVNKVVE